MMRVLFDGQIFWQQPAGGISRYFTKLAEGINIEPECSARILAPLHRNEHLRGLSNKICNGIALPSNRLTYRLARAVTQRASNIFARNCHYDLVHETYFSAKPLIGGAPRRLTTIYDMIHELFMPGSSTTEHKKASLKRCDHVICISQSTKNDLIRFFGYPPERSTVVYLGYHDCSVGTLSKKYPSFTTHPYFLYVGYRGGYKNFTTFLRAIARVPRLSRDFRIVCFGGGPLTENEKMLTRELGLPATHILQLNGSDDVLAAAYRNAAAFVYPSLYEGFGLPPLEAMSAGCPVVCSDRSSIPEVVGDAARYFDPGDVESVSDALEQVAYDSVLREALVRSGHARRMQFSWERCVRETLAVYRSLN